MKRTSAFGVFFLMLVLAPAAVAGDDKEELWAAARKGDAAAVKALLAKGVDVNAKTAYGATALHFAADKGHLEVVRLLLERKANVNAKDTFYSATPLTWAISRNHWKIVEALVEARAEGAVNLLSSATEQGQTELVRAILAKNKVSQSTLDAVLAAVPAKHLEIAELLKKAGAKVVAKPQTPNQKPASPSAEELKVFTGTYEDDRSEFTIAVKEGKLHLAYGGRSLLVLIPAGSNTFKTSLDGSTTLTFQRQGERVVGFVFKTGATSSTFKHVEPRKVEEPQPVFVADDKPVTVRLRQNWPSFRGPHASGVGDGQMPPSVWDVNKGVNVLWKTPIPGLGHSCPIVWEERLYLTTAISGDAKAGLRVGLYGDVDSVNDSSVHRWCVYCLDKSTGKVLWERTAHEGVPKVKRHMKSTHANPTPATDGKHMVACFGSEGLYCYDCDGKFLWRCDLGVLDSGWFYDPDYQWGFGSSPIIYRNQVIVQCDAGKNSFLAAYDVETGKRVWLTPREEIPSWGTPTICESKARVELVTNATNFIRSYDPLTGKELWRLARNAEITVPTPIFGQGLIFVTSGYRPIQPIYAIRPGGSGDISLKDKQEASANIAWSKSRGGTYMPTPIVYGDYLYSCSNDGLVTCYEAKTGKQIYRERLRGKGGYTASPVAADGKLYFTSEEGDVAVLQAGPKFIKLASNALGDVCMATPAIADGMIFFRTQHSVIGIGRQLAALDQKPKAVATGHRSRNGGRRCSWWRR